MGRSSVYFFSDGTALTAPVSVSNATFCVVRSAEQYHRAGVRVL